MCSASNPISHHTSHTLANGASSSNKGAHGDGGNPYENGGKRSSCRQIVSSLFFIQDTTTELSPRPLQRALLATFPT
jgi:hypothetical protein